MDTLAVAQNTIQNNGGTFSHALGTIREAVTPKDAANAWLVAVEPAHWGKNTVTEVTSISRNTGFSEREIITGAVWDFIRNHHDGMSHFGTWLDNGKLYIDHVIFTDRENAERIARERGELAIFNLSTKETVSL